MRLQDSQPADCLAPKSNVASGAMNAPPRLKSRNNGKVTCVRDSAHEKVIRGVRGQRASIGSTRTSRATPARPICPEVRSRRPIDPWCDSDTLRGRFCSSNMVLHLSQYPATKRTTRNRIVHTFYLTHAYRRDVGRHAEINDRRPKPCSSMSAPAWS